jgi:lactate dehydrogenase-like 2-hydroxyacid dehydrogenase
VEEQFGVSYLPLEELAAQCDILSLHCAVNDQTRGMVNAALLSHIKPGAILVNTARGDLVDDMAVRQALLDGTLGGIAMDTLAPEPTPADHPLVDLPPQVQDRAVYSPHLGGLTGGSFRRAHANMWNSARLVLEGQRPNFIVNGL